MRRTAVAGIGMALVLSASGIALAQPGGGSSTGGLKMKASPTKNVKSGQKIKVKATGAKKNSEFYCALTILNRKNKNDYVANAASTQQIKASKHGTFNCTEKFKPFHGTSTGGTNVSCPVSKKLSKKFTCAIGVADVATEGQTQGASKYFTAKK